MDEEKKDQVLFGMFSAESKGLDGHAKAKHIKDKMRAIHGGVWVATFWKRGEGDTSLNYEPGFLAKFLYEGNRWHVAKASENSTLEIPPSWNS